MTFAGFTAHFDAEFIHLAAENGGEGKHTTHTLVHKILCCADRIGSFRLSLAAGEAIGVVAAAESADTEVIRGTELVVVVHSPAQWKEILILIVGARQRTDRRCVIARGQQGLAHGSQTLYKPIGRIFVVLAVGGRSMGPASASKRLAGYEVRAPGGQKTVLAGPFSR